MVCLPTFTSHATQMQVLDHTLSIWDRNPIRFFRHYQFGTVDDWKNILQQLKHYQPLADCPCELVQDFFSQHLLRLFVWCFFDPFYHGIHDHQIIIIWEISLELCFTHQPPCTSKTPASNYLRIFRSAQIHVQLNPCEWIARNIYMCSHNLSERKANLALEKWCLEDSFLSFLEPGEFSRANC